MGSSSSAPRPSESSSRTTTTQATAPPATDVVSDANAVFRLMLMNQEITTSPLDRIRTALDHSVRGMLSTFSPKHEGSMVGYACDADGSLIIAFTRLSVHANVLMHRPKCVFLVACEDVSRDDGFIITVHGDAVLVSDEDRELVRSLYARKHPDAVSVEGDFQFIRIEPEVVRYVFGYGVGMVSGEFSSEEFKNGKVDLLLSADLILRSVQLDESNSNTFFLDS